MSNDIGNPGGKPRERPVNAFPRSQNNIDTGVLPSSHQLDSQPGQLPFHDPADYTRGMARQAALQMMDDPELQLLSRQLFAVDYFVNQRHMTHLSEGTVQALPPYIQDRNIIRVLEITKIVFNQQEDVFEKLVSVYSAMNSMGGLLGLIIHSDGSTTRLYFCTAMNGDAEEPMQLLRANLSGHFPGCGLRELKRPEADAIFRDINRDQPLGRTVRAVSMIPARREAEMEKAFSLSAQGIEKFVDAMEGESYVVLILAQKVKQEAIDSCKAGFERLHTMLSPFAKESISYGESDTEGVTSSLARNVGSTVTEGISETFGSNYTNSVSSGRSGGTSDNSGTSYNMTGFFGDQYTKSSGSGSNTGWNQSKSNSTGTNKSIGDSHSAAQSEGETSTSGDSRSKTSTKTVNMSRENRAVAGCLKQLDEYIERIDKNRHFGMWSSCCYVIADSIRIATMCSSTLSSLLAGEKGAQSQVFTNQWTTSGNMGNLKNMLDSLSFMRHPEIELSFGGDLAINSQIITPGMLVSGRELPLLMNLPKRSLTGLSVTQKVEFGRTLLHSWKAGIPEKNRISFGNIFHMGKVERAPLCLDKNAFAAHCFICGAAGSGKSNTTYQLLQSMHERKIPFLVVEPAKGEYKIVFGGLPGINIFTANGGAYRTLMINPFEFNPRVHITEHLAYLLGVITSCWPLYGPMPAMMKQAFEEVYIKFGWDLETSTQVFDAGQVFPTFADLLPVIERILNESPYSAQTKGDFKGALIMRIKMLLNGFEGKIFSNARGVPDTELFDQNTIVDLSNIGSSETRSLVMGTLIIKLREYRFSSTVDRNAGLRHVMVLEEAHNILKRCSHEAGEDSSNVQGAAIGMLVDSIAEMRSCGEGFIIIDQSPGQVDLAAIKNTAIKIVMRLPEKEDCEVIGNALSLHEEQIRELSKLDVGVAAIYHVGWEETILGKMGEIWDNRYTRKREMPNILSMKRLKGALAQQLYARVSQGDYFNLLRDLRASSASMRKDLTGLHADLVKEIDYSLMEFLSMLSQSPEEEEIRRLKEALPGFLMNFLSLRGMLRAIDLLLAPRQKTKDAELTQEEKDTINTWYQKVLTACNKYLSLLREWDNTTAWVGDATLAVDFSKMIGEILMVYGQQHAVQNNSDIRYISAHAYLEKMRRFL